LGLDFLAKHLGALGVHFLVLRRDPDSLGVGDPFGKLLPSPDRLELLLLEGQPLLRFFEPVAHVVEAHSGLDERVLHPRGNGAALLGLCSAREEIVEGAAETVEHHGVVLAQ